MHMLTSVTLGIAREFATVAVLPLLLFCRLAAITGTSCAHHKTGRKKDFTKDYEVTVGMDPITLKIRAALAPLRKRYRFAQLLKLSTERRD